MSTDYRGIFPGTFTMGNVVCGFISILSAFEGNVTTAAWFIILAGFLDALDGRVARLSGTTSQFGVELDSLADFLSFSVAPAVLVYTIKLSALGKWGWIISIVYIMAAAYRLARFNLMADSEEKKNFVGLPVPAGAFLMVSYIIFCYNLWGHLRYDEVLVSMIIVISFLMVSQIEYDAMPDKFTTREDKLKYIAIVVGIIAVIIRPRLLLFPLVSVYILSGMFREAYRLSNAGVGKVTGRRKTDREQVNGEK